MKDPVKERARRKAYYERNRERILENKRIAHKKYYDSNKEEILAKRRLIPETNEQREARLTQNNDRYYSRKDFVSWFKLMSGCMDCGYKEHPVALDFDHRPGEEKRETISKMLQCSAWNTLIAEMEKCDVVCANCHRIRSFVRKDNKIRYEKGIKT